MPDTPTPTRKHRGWLKNPRKAREGEQIGGGFFIFRRGDGTKRIRPQMWPYEHPSRESAEAELQRLQGIQPDSKFEIYARVEV